jgi:2-keto-4-pentenoate hydratase
MAESGVAAAAAWIVEARLARRAIGPHPDVTTIELGYEVQQAANALLEQQLGPRVGHKIGGTTAPMRAYLNLPEPVGGEIFATTVFPDGATLRLADYRRPGIETEIAVRLGQDLPPQDDLYTPEDVAAAVDEVMAAIEVVDDRYEDFRTLGAPTLVADNAFDAGSVLGHAVRDLNPMDTGRLEARTLVDGREVATGLSDMLLGHPMDALAWLANRRSSLGLGLEAGSFVSLGSITPVQWLDRPAAFRIEVEGLGAVELRFA